MEQSTKLFLVLGFGFVLYTTMNGHLEKYLKIIFGGKSSSGGILGDVGSAFGLSQSSLDALNTASTIFPQIAG